jgi:hypothetical protein
MNIEIKHIIRTQTGFEECVREEAAHLATLTLFYTRGLVIVILHVMVPQPYRFSP